MHEVVMFENKNSVFFAVTVFICLRQCWKNQEEAASSPQPRERMAPMVWTAAGKNHRPLEATLGARSSLVLTATLYKTITIGFSKRC